MENGAVELSEAGETTTGAAARKRAAVEIVARYESALRRTARRYSLSNEDAEDALQRALEILLTKAPTTDPRELIRWTQTVTKHEALAVRRGRERSMRRIATSPPQGEPVDWVALIPAAGGGPDEQAERRDEIARTREALRALKPAERRALSLLASGCSYAEIGRITGFSATKVNRSIAEGRARFRRILSGSEDGSRCTELRPLLSAFCDGEASPEETALLREHLRACGPCRATMRAYRATPRAVAALAPAPLGAGSLFERVREAVAELGSRLPGGGGAGEAATQAAASGGAAGAGTAALAKVAVVCAGAGGVACVAAGVVPVPIDLSAGAAKQAAIERPAERVVEEAAGDGTEAGTAPRRPARSEPKRREREPGSAAAGGREPAESEASAESVQAEPVEYAPPAEYAPPSEAASSPSPPPAPTASPSTSSGSAAGEFGP